METWLQCSGVKAVGNLLCPEEFGFIRKLGPVHFPVPRSQVLRGSWPSLPKKAKAGWCSGLWLGTVTSTPHLLCGAQAAWAFSLQASGPGVVGLCTKSSFLS